MALVSSRRGAPDPAVLRRALFAWAFNPGTRNLTAPAETASALEWITRASLPVTALEDDAAAIRLALGACARTGTGTPAAASTQRRKRAVFYNAVGYAVELRLLASNPIDRIQWKTPAVAQTVDRRVVAGPAQARALLAAVRAVSDRGAHLEAFYACLYYAALRPSEAVMLRESDCHLPGRRWGRIDLAASAPRAGRDWTDDGTARQARGLKHRAQHENPVHPHPARPGPDPPRPPQALRHHPGRADLPHRTRRHPPGQRLQRRLGRRPRRRPHPRPARLPAGPPPLRPAARRRLPVAELRRPRHRSRPPRRAQRRRPAQDLRPLHRRPGRRRQQAHRRRPRQHRGQPG